MKIRFIIYVAAVCMFVLYGIQKVDARRGEQLHQSVYHDEDDDGISDDDDWDDEDDYGATR